MKPGKVWLVVLMGVFAGALSASALTAPTLKMAGFCNGKLTVAVRYTDIDAYSLQVQMKDQGADDSTYVDVYKGKVSPLTSVTGNGYGARYFNFTTNFYGTATLRMRTFSGEETSEWVPVGDLSAYVNVKGTVIGTAGSASSRVFDGNCFSWIDDSSNPWVGYDFGKPTRLSRIRFFSRPEDGGCERIRGAQVQSASDANFTDVQVLFTADANNTSRTAVNDIVFDEPITVTCLRVVSSLTRTDGRSSLAELEAVPVDVPFVPEVHVARGEQPTCYPVVSWTLPSELAATKVTVGRATSPVGPFKALAADLAPDATYTDETAKVGILYYYQVTCDCNHPLFPGQTASVLATGRRVRRLDRSHEDETKLLDGVSIMVPTNGNWGAVSSARGWTLAWDGNANTWPDMSDQAYRNGPIGLKFDVKTWVSSFSYQCRTDGYANARVKNTALFAASGEDLELGDKVQVSALCQQASQSTTLYSQDCTTVLEDGAYCYFLYAFANVTDGGTFCGNVAELMLFGWTQADIDNAGILVAPTSLSFARSADGRTVSLAWDAGTSATDGYVVQRRARGAGDDAWVDIATTSAGVTTCDDRSEAEENPLTPGFWEYRVGGKQDSETAFSPVFGYTYYAPGAGTGLRGAVFHPFAANVAALGRPDEKYDLGVGTVNFTWAQGENYAGTDFSTNARLAWRGKLIVPIEGSYDFSLETSDGGAVYIDNTSVCNVWTGGSKTSTGSVNLKAGEHTIEVDARLQSDYSAGRKCILRWGGTVPNEVIPATQLKPAADVTLGCTAWNLDWKVREYNGAILGKVVANNSNSWRMTAQPGEPSSADGRNQLNATFLARSWSRSFDIQTRVAHYMGGRAGLMARAANGGLYGVYFNYDGSGNSWVGIYMVTNGSDKLVSPFVQKQIKGFSNTSADLRLAYDVRTGTFTAWWKDDAKIAGDEQNPLEWTVLHTWQNDGSIVGEYEYGLLQMGSTSNKQSGFYFSNYSEKLKRHDGTLLLVR